MAEGDIFCFAFYIGQDVQDSSRVRQSNECHSNRFFIATIFLRGRRRCGYLRLLTDGTQVIAKEPYINSPPHLTLLFVGGVIIGS